MLPASATPSRCNIGFGFLKSAMKNQPTPYLLKHSVQHWNCLLQTMHSQLKLQQLHRQFCNICDIELEKLGVGKCTSGHVLQSQKSISFAWDHGYGTQRTSHLSSFNIERRWLIYIMFDKLVGWILRFFSPAASNLVPHREGPPSIQGACSWCSATLNKGRG